MSDFAAINGQRCTSVRLHVPNRGAWFAMCELDSDPALEGQVTLKFGELTLNGTIVPSYSGAYNAKRKVSIVGGAGGWGILLPPTSYHNDAGVKAILIAQDAARLVGETLGDFAPEADRIGLDYVRDASMLASRVLEDVIGDRVWWVDFAGVTHAGERPTAPALKADSYRVLSYDPNAQVASLEVTDPSLVSIGTVLASPALPAPITVREYGVQVDSDGLRILAWCGGGERSAGRLSELWRRLVARTAESHLFGLYRYRVVSMANIDGRVTLQSVKRASGLPDIATISQWPGVAGTYTELTPGAEVLVQFIEGDRAQPIVTHYAGRDGSGFVPVQLVLGGAEGQPVARLGDTVEVLLPPMTFTGTVSGAPAVGVAFVPGGTVLGTITTGSSKVKAAP